MGKKNSTKVALCLELPLYDIFSILKVKADFSLCDNDKFAGGQK